VPLEDSATVARLHRRDEDVAWLSRFQDHLAVFHQIIDDLDELEQSLHVARVRWVFGAMLPQVVGAAGAPEGG